MGIKIKILKSHKNNYMNYKVKLKIWNNRWVIYKGIIIFNYLDGMKLNWKKKIKLYKEILNIK